MPEIIDVGGQHKCAYEHCKCRVSTLKTYCSDYCSDADSAEIVAMQCDCKHAPCSLMEGDPFHTTLDQQE